MRWMPLLLLLSACAPVNPGFGEGRLVPEDDDDEPQPSVVDTAGSVGIFYWEKPDENGAFSAGAQFSGSFWDVLVEGEPGEGGVEIAAPQTVDDCVVTTWSAADLEVSGGVDEIRQSLLVGQIALDSPSWTTDVVPNATDGPTTYYFELNPDHEVHFEAPYSISAPGGTFPGFTEPEFLELPAALSLVSPATDDVFDLDGGDFDLEWVGGSEEFLWIELANEQPQTDVNVQVNCYVENDGAFTMPADVMAAVPEGPELRLTLDQPISDSFYVDGFDVGIGATASAQALGRR